MPNKWDSRWDNWCHLRANNPTRREWLWVAAGLAALMAVAAVIGWFWC